MAAYAVGRSKRTFEQRVEVAAERVGSHRREVVLFEFEVTPRIADQHVACEVCCLLFSFEGELGPARDGIVQRLLELHELALLEGLGLLVAHRRAVAHVHEQTTRRILGLLGEG